MRRTAVCLLFAAGCLASASFGCDDGSGGDADADLDADEDRDGDADGVSDADWDSVCLREGASGYVVPGAPTCCPGLAQIGCEEPTETGECPVCGGSYVCAFCPDGTCGSGENACNCKDDCD